MKPRVREISDGDYFKAEVQFPYVDMLVMAKSRRELAAKVTALIKRVMARHAL